MGGSYFGLTDIVILIIGNIPVILFGLLTLALYYIYTKLLNPTITFIDDNIFEPVVNTVNKTVDKIKKEFGTELKAIGDFGSKAGKEIGKIKSDIIVPFRKALEAIGFIGGLIGDVEDGVKAVGNVGVRVFDDGVDGVKKIGNLASHLNPF